MIYKQKLLAYMIFIFLVIGFENIFAFNSNQQELIKNFFNDYAETILRMAYPIYPGKTWQQTTTETNIKTGEIRIHKIFAEVEQWEDISVYAGTFHALKIKLNNELFDSKTGESKSGSDVSWYAPELHRSVKTIEIEEDGKQTEIQLVEYDLN